MTSLNSLSLILMLITIATSSAGGQEHFVQRFDSEAINTHVFKVIGPQAGDVLRQTAKGLVITLPVKKQKNARVGAQTKFHVVGDFEITVGYELSAVEKPTKGYGAGVAVILIKQDESKRVAIARRRLPDGRDIVRTNVMVTTPKKLERDPKDSMAQASHGQLRLVRTGSTLRFLYAEEVDGVFQELRQVEGFGAEPIRTVQVLADTGGSEEPLTVRLTQLSIRADALPFGMPAPERRTIWGVWTVFGLLGLLGVVACGIWYLRQRRAPDMHHFKVR